MANRWLTASLLAAALAGCGRSDDGAVDIAFIDTPESLFASGVRLSAGAQHVRAATSTGLVAFDAQGEVVPALADRWIVTDDGRSYIFRLRDGTWPDGRDLTAESARAALNEAIRRLRGTSLGLDLAPVAEVRAMAGRVIEIRLSSPVPTLIQLLAQPELALSRGAGGSGAMRLDRDGDRAVLAMKPPAARGVPEEAGWAKYVRPIVLTAASGEQAVKLFDEGEVDIVLGGGIDALPLVETGPLSRGTVRLDPAFGLFGLQVRRGRGLLASRDGREAIAMAIDREALIEPFGIGGWTPTTRLVAPGLPGDPGLVDERWSGRSIEDNRALAAARVAAWRRRNGGSEARLTLALGRGAGFDLLFRELAAQLAAIGVRLERVPEGGPADLAVVDRLARYAEPRWFLNQFNCSLGNGMCSSEADSLVSGAIAQSDPAARATLFAQAEAELNGANVYIAFGSPVRFSLVRGNVEGFVANPWAFHPLPPLAVIPR
jgi:oligopeptide transport system substrate-binding protein